ncbi:UDP-N-acetylmuramoyl-tripeptide--D-alanyl-D-alanine ligase [Clostridium boliviensis]|uniref:UDP-N-acetylmuramoyl-tripeptide--D-alanyl-D-alanine ligase n=1 Tax=Clostridium boliviensis TaxID=318465 RepID=A0ABU4GHF7_9CLOT|nr:UDP-N-acetylmuramoyl-tripeptide--D-alanyl-D-alanine ligase [Clostridium boliviensis]MDW2796410.1 UDP-N-acetylmuramoyl-tripeptide--D-alanyl-D-alanine ligase [Clostridium boliviensis]
MKYKEKSGAVTIIGDNVSPVKVCDIKNGRPKVKRSETADYYEFTLIYSLFHRVKKKYDKKTLKEIK